MSFLYEIDNRENNGKPVIYDDAGLVKATTMDVSFENDHSQGSNPDVHVVLKLERTTSGTASNGIGVGIDFQSENDGGTSISVGTIDTSLTNVNDGAENGQILLRTISSGTVKDAVVFDTDGIDLKETGGVYKIKTKTKDEPINIFNEAINNIKPTVEVRSRRVGGATYQVPVEVKSKRAQALAIRWLVDSARKRKDKHMSDKIFNELYDAYEKKGAAVKKREDVHKMAESNKAFAHFRW